MGEPDFRRQVTSKFEEKGVRWSFAPHDVQGGKKLHEQIDEAIWRCERLLLILSPNRNHDPYQKEFEKLLRDLRTEESKET